MKKNIQIMDRELLTLCAYRALIVERRIFLIIMAVFFTYGIYHHVYSRPIIYLSLTYFLLPAAVSALYSGYKNEKKKPTKSSPQFPTLWKRYLYTPSKLRDLSIGSLIEVGLLILWQFTSAVSFPSKFFTFLPCIMSIFLLVFFFLGTLFLFVWQKKNLMNGKL